MAKRPPTTAEEFDLHQSLEALLETRDNLHHWQTMAETAEVIALSAMVEEGVTTTTMAFDDEMVKFTYVAPERVKIDEGKLIAALKKARVSQSSVQVEQRLVSWNENLIEALVAAGKLPATIYTTTPTKKYVKITRHPKKGKGK